MKMVGLIKWTLPLLLLILCNYTVSALISVPSLTVDPLGSLTSGTPVTIQSRVEISGVFPSAGEIQFFTDLDNPHWTYTILVNGIENLRPVMGGHTLTISGFELYYHPSDQVSVLITVEGTAPSVTQTSNKTLIRITEYDGNGKIVNSTPVERIAQVINTSIPTLTGVFRPGVGFYLKMDTSSAWTPGPDIYMAWDNAAGDLPLAGDWNRDGRTETGVYRPGAGFYLKMDNSSTWTPATDIYLAWDNAAHDLPLAGDWNRDGITETGVYRPGAGFYLKMDNSSTWTASTDVYLAWDNAANDLPIAGDWNMDGKTETGVYRPGVGFYLKMDNGSPWTPLTDVYLAWDNAANDLPLAGDWNMDGRTETGVYRPGAGFYLKMDNGSPWTPSTDIYLAWDNDDRDLPIAGTWAVTLQQPFATITFTRDLTIMPSTNLSIMVGGKVIWKNDDPFKPHGIAAVDAQGAKYFGGLTGVQIPYNKTYEVTFDTVGTFNYETIFQPETTGSIIVTD
jgi:hypothetical protein